MSRTGKQPISVPDKVKIKQEGLALFVEGPLGKEEVLLSPWTNLEVKDSKITVTRKNNEKKSREAHGLVRALVRNAVQGVSNGFTKELEIEGVGYRADVQGKAINLTLGFSHPISFPLPDGIKATVDKQTKIKLTGSSLPLLGQVAANIRSLRPPEPYKGKGIRYAGEVIQRKAGKSAAGGGK